MAQLVVFILVIALVYAAKAAVIALTRDELVQDDAAFSWATLRSQDVKAAESGAAAERAAATEPRAVIGAPMRRAGRAGA